LPFAICHLHRVFVGGLLFARLAGRQPARLKKNVSDKACRPSRPPSGLLVC
jgi:hypothetical protein